MRNIETNLSRTDLPARANILIGIGIGVVLSFLCCMLVAGSVLITSANLTADCTKRGSSITDAFRVQMFASGIFGRDLWSESFSSSPERVTKTWLSNDAVAYLEYLVYNCGYTQSDVDAYFNDENFIKIFLQNYQDAKKTTECSGNGLQLYEFTGKHNDENYLIYFWVKQESSSRIIDFMMAFPATKQDELKKYAQQIYSELPTCE